MVEPFKKKTYLAMTLDPVHIGTGGYRLGRVDNTITREPGTNLPKIPGSSIAGVTRAYTAMAVQNGKFIKIGEDKKIYYQTYLKLKYQRPAYQLKISDDKKTAIITYLKGKPLYAGEKPEEPKYYSCAGKGADDGEGHCGRPDCEVCVPFGFSRGKSNSSFQGLAQFYDARILFFPVYSMTGPVWISCPSVLNDFRETLKSQSKTIEIQGSLDNDDFIQTALVESDKNLNLGWLLLKNKQKLSPIKGNIPNLSSEVVNRSVLVSDKIFSRIVNDNLEVRTSVAIDPATGAAEDGALYTYEAIPRATVMWFDVIYNKPEYFRIDGDKEIELTKPEGYYNPLGNSKTEDQIGFMAFNVEKGLKYLEALGIGGMNTRGMGRLRILNVGGQNNGTT